jgi:hypothetical protein
MYCCACGCVLTAENSAGLVCVSCKLPARPRGQGRRSKGVLLLHVKYCFVCGKKFHPDERAIGHRRALDSSCFEEEHNGTVAWWA